MSTLRRFGKARHFIPTTFLVRVQHFRFIYIFLNVCPFDYTSAAGSWKVGPVNQVNHTSWVAVVTPTDRPTSVRNRCVIELFCGVVLENAFK